MKLKIDLFDLSSFDEAIAQIDKVKDSLPKKTEEIVKVIAEKGEEEAKNNASYMNIYDTGELMAGIIHTVDGAEGKVISTAAHSAFCEFGTGIVGKQNQHPEPALAGWRYDVNEHGEEGWYYIGKDGKLHWTKGMPSRPFMYDTAQTLKANAGEIMKEVLDLD